MEVRLMMKSSSPVATGYIAHGGWNWSYPAIAKVAGTAGNLEKWVNNRKFNKKYDNVENR